jgi:hypothetical protein
MKTVYVVMAHYSTASVIVGVFSNQFDADKYAMGYPHKFGRAFQVIDWDIDKPVLPSAIGLLEMFT